jgi:hypothetical protein
MSENFLAIDNGNEIRSLAAQTAVPTSTWISTSRRVDGNCSHNKVAGSYLLSCKSLDTLTDPSTKTDTIFAGASLIRMDIARDGSYTGSLSGKIGPVILPATVVSGKMKVSDDCTAEGILDIPGVGQNVAKSVFFNEGKEGYWLPLKSTPTSQPYAYCDIKQIANR